MSSILARPNAVIPATGATDLSAKKGSLVTLGVTAGVNTATLSASATVPASGVVLDGATTSAPSSIGILGSVEGTVWIKTSGAITFGARVMQAADDTIVTDVGPGTARVVVGIALQTGVAGDLIEVAPIGPFILP